MTPEYAALSLRSGILAATIDLYLGGKDAERYMREHAWDLSERLVAEVKLLAQACGVPPAVLADAEDEARKIIDDHKLMARLVRLQLQKDEERPN